MDSLAKGKLAVEVEEPKVAPTSASGGSDVTVDSSVEAREARIKAREEGRAALSAAKLEAIELLKTQLKHGDPGVAHNAAQTIMIYSDRL